MLHNSQLYTGSHTAMTDRAPFPQVESSEEFSCPTESGTFPDSYDCRYFYVCTNSTPVREMCPEPLVFNPAYLNCDYPQNVPECQ